MRTVSYDSVVRSTANYLDKGQVIGVAAVEMLLEVQWLGHHRKSIFVVLVSELLVLVQAKSEHHVVFVIIVHIYSCYKCAVT